jgi:hypothetical protein
LKSVIGHLKSDWKLPMPDARFQDFRAGCPLMAATVQL